MSRGVGGGVARRGVYAVRTAVRGTVAESAPAGVPCARSAVEQVLNSGPLFVDHAVHDRLPRAGHRGHRPEESAQFGRRGPLGRFLGEAAGDDPCAFR